MKTRPWITLDQLDNPRSIDADDAIQAASFILFTLSGQKYTGVWSTTEQYFCETSGAPNNCYWDDNARKYWNPDYGVWTLPFLPSERATMLRYGKRFRLNSVPVRQITEIVVDGVTLDPSTYALKNHSLVESTSSWGVCDGPVVSYEFGRQVPALGRIAARRLANELVLASEGSANCSLPQNVTSISRQGMTIDIWDPKDFLDKGRTGLYEVDLFIAAANPAGAKKPAKIFSPDARRGYRTN